MKKITAVLLCVLCLMSAISMNGFAVSESQGMDALRKQFKSGESVLDYVYYSPVKDNKDETKYPVVVWLHGNSSGDYPGHQLDNCNIALWSSSEYQSRFVDVGGAYLLLPRYPTSKISVAWESGTGNLKGTIDDFVKAHIDNVDTNKIYIGGYSMGGKMTLRMAMNYPSYFAAAFPLSPVYAPTNMDLNNLIDMPIWFFWCKNDDYASLNDLTVRSNWQYLMSISNCRENCRLSVFDTIYNSDYTIKTADGKNDIHNTWDAACHDLFMNDGRAQKDMKVTDGNNKTVNLTYPRGLIHWLSSQSKEETDGGKNQGTIRGILETMIGIFLATLLEIINAIRY